MRNERSQRAIERLGAVREGVLRNNMILQDGFVRSSVYYSITDAEWPALRSAYAAWLDRANFDDAGRQVRTLEQIHAATGR